MSAPSLATVGGRLLSEGYAGDLVDTRDASASRVLTYHNESATAIDFGLAVAISAVAGAANDRMCKPVGADADVIIGISVRNVAKVANSDGTVTANQYDEVSVLLNGDIRVLAYENVVRGDGAISVSAQGGKISGTTAGAAGTGRVAVPNAKWLTTTSAGSIGIVRIVN